MYGGERRCIDNLITQHRQNNQVLIVLTSRYSVVSFFSLYSRMRCGDCVITHLARRRTSGSREFCRTGLRYSIAHTEVQNVTMRFLRG